jgi:cytochrome b pre-mRNA-processing protein 3
MILRLFRRQFQPETIDWLYGVIVAQARRPEFYAEFGVPDTVEGRFDMVVLQLAMVLRRLAREPGGEALGRALLDAFARDMDDNLREMGVGDLAVPKQIKRMMEAFYGRSRSYGSALAGDEPATLERALVRNVFAGREGAGATLLAAYVGRATMQLEATEGGQILAGSLAFPAPRAIFGDVPTQSSRSEGE